MGTFNVHDAELVCVSWEPANVHSNATLEY
jgi:hypothetical protein